MTSLINKKNTSTHGKVLLQELSIPINKSNCSVDIKTIISEKLDLCLSYIKKDSNAALLKQQITGNNAYHLLLGSNFPEEFIFPLLQKFYEISPKGVEALNSFNNTPLHYYLSQSNISIDIAIYLLSIYPKATSISNSSSYLPLFLLFMHENPSFVLAKEIIKLYPQVCMMKNSTNSLALHFLCRRKVIDSKIIKMLIRRNPMACSQMNDYGLLPLHCLSIYNNTLECIRLVYEAYPPAITIQDRYGRTCLHQSVLAMGKEYMSSWTEELREEEMILNQSSIDNQSDNKDNIDIDKLDIELENEFDIKSDSYIDKQTKTREVIRYYIDMYPRALVTYNNFQSIPVDTVIDKSITKETYSKRTKYKKISTYGLYDDPPTARMLLYKHYNYSTIGYIDKHINNIVVKDLDNQIDNQIDSQGTFQLETLTINKPLSRLIYLPRLTPRYLSILRDLNWLARKQAILVSFGNVNISNYLSKLKKINSKLNSKIVSKVDGNLESKVDSNNILARLRYAGLIDCLRLCIMFI